MLWDRYVIVLQNKNDEHSGQSRPVLEDRDAGYIKERLTSEVTEALNELKDYNPADFYSDEYVEGEDDGTNLTFKSTLKR